MTDLYLSEDFTITCGTVLVKQSNKTICLLHRATEERQEYILPKGRKQIDRSLQKTATEETFNETGYKCSILPLTMETRATPQVQIGYTPDKPETESNCTEPVATTIRNTDDGVKISFWFVVKLDESVEQDLSTSIGCEKFNAQWFTFEQAVDLLEFDHEKQIVEKVAKLYRDTYKN